MSTGVRQLFATLVAVVALVGTPVLARGASAAPPHTVGFYTPGSSASCDFLGLLAAGDRAPALWCGRNGQPQIGFVLRWGGVKEVTPHGPNVSDQPRVNGGGVPRDPDFLLHFGEDWWGNRQGDEGTGRSWGRVLFRCTSRENGLTCRTRSGHGFWLGRTRGHRIF